MSDITFTIRKVFSGSEAQKKIGIHASFTMTIDGPDGIIAQIQDMKLRQTRDGKYYIESAFRTYQGKDKEGNEKEQKLNFVKFFPEEKNWSKQDAIVALVLSELKNNENRPPQNTKPKQNMDRPPVKAAPKTNESEPW
jgi:hypothetical protein